MFVCLAIHWLALKTWFWGDDFAWLGLRLELHTPRDLIHILFGAQAQGTVRTISERLFFLTLTSIFGLASPPFRAVVFLTQLANIALIVKITRRITGSAIAGPMAAILWTVNAGLATALGWSSAYNEIALAFFILLAFHLFLKYIDTGERKFLIWQWIVFILGFGVLELNVMYPVLAAGYALCCARSHVRTALLLFIPSILFTAAHFLLVPAPTDPYYQMHYASAPATFGNYWAWTIGAFRKAPVDWRPTWLGLLLMSAVTLALAWFTWRKVRANDWRPIFLLGWFAAMILPVLPLENHFTEYYVVVPSIGLAMLAAWAIVETPAAAALAALYLVVCVTDTRTVERYNYDRARAVKYLVKDLESQPKDRMILMAGVDNDLYWTGFYPDPFRLIGLQEIYLVPGSERDIDPHPELGGISRYVIDRNRATTALREKRAIVLQLDGRRLRDVSAEYLAALDPEHAGNGADRVDIGDPKFATRLGPGWLPIENRYRWMGQKATVTMARPSHPGEILKINGYCPAPLLAQGPVDVTFRTGDIVIGKATLNKPEQFELMFPVPPQLIGGSVMDIDIELGRAFQPAGEARSLGLTFGTFALK